VLVRNGMRSGRHVMRRVVSSTGQIVKCMGGLRGGCHMMGRVMSRMMRSSRHAVECLDSMGALCRPRQRTCNDTVLDTR
jgi:hypothetical protein